MKSIIENGRIGPMNLVHSLPVKQTLKYQQPTTNNKKNTPTTNPKRSRNKFIVYLNEAAKRIRAQVVLPFWKSFTSSGFSSCSYRSILTYTCIQWIICNMSKMGIKTKRTKQKCKENDGKKNIYIRPSSSHSTFYSTFVVVQCYSNEKKKRRKKKKTMNMREWI